MGFSKRERGIKWVVSLLHSFNSFVHLYYRNYSVIGILLFCNGVFYLAAICYFSDFTSDDFYIYSLIKENPSQPISLNRNEIFFLWLRPVSYFSFWIDYHLFSQNAFMMKLLSLILHLLLIWIVYQFIVNIEELLRIKRNRTLSLLILIVFSFHPDIMSYILQINNRTELIMLLFYSASLVVLLKYMNGKIRSVYFIPAFISLFILSLLSKQNGIHIPFLMLLIIIYFRDMMVDRRKVLLFVAVFLSLLVLLFSYMNYLYISTNYDFIELISTKPFTLIGILWFVVFPHFAEDIYIWFLIHQQIAVASAIVILVLCVLYLLKREKIKHILISGCFFTCLFYPRIFSLGGGRINSHLVLWLAVMLFIVLSQLNIRYSYLIMIIYILSILSYSIKFLIETHEYQQIRNQQLSELAILSSRLNILPLVAESSCLLNELYFFNNHDFGGSKNKYQPLIYKYLFPRMRAQKKAIRCEVYNGIFQFTSQNPFVYIGESPLNRLKKRFKVSPTGQKKREYYCYSLMIPDSIRENYTLVFHNGLNWEIIN